MATATKEKTTTNNSSTSLVQVTATELNLTPSYVQLVKDVYARNATDEELALFLRTSNRLGLDPTARQIFLVKRWDSGLKREVATPQVSIDGFRAVADRTGRYVPGRESTYERDADGHLVSATAWIKKKVGDDWFDISSTAFYNEYVQKTKEGQPNSMWNKMPHLMLAKCAEALVLRKAFPAELSGVYTSDEMGQASSEVPATGSGYGVPISGSTVAERPGAGAEARRMTAIEKEQERIVGLCQELNTAKDSIVWTKVQIKEYCQSLFDDESIASADDLTLEQLKVLAEDLELRLDGLR